MANELNNTVKQIVRDSILSQDLVQYGAVKQHMKSATEGGAKDQPTGEVYFTAQLRMPKGEKIMLNGQELFSDQITIRIDAFNLYDEAKVADAPAPKAATASADLLKTRFSKGSDTPVVVNPAK